MAPLLIRVPLEVQVGRHDVPRITLNIEHSVRATRLPHDGPASQLTIVHLARPHDKEFSEVPESPSGDVQEFVDLESGAIALIVLLRLRAKDAEHRLIPPRLLGPEVIDVEAVPDVVCRALEGVVIRLEARSTRIDRAFPHPIASLLCDSSVSAKPAQARGARVVAAREEPAPADPTIRALKVASARLLPIRNFPRVARDVRDRRIGHQRISIVSPAVDDIVAIQLGVAREPRRKGGIDAPDDARQHATDDEIAMQEVTLEPANEIIGEGLDLL